MMDINNVIERQKTLQKMFGFPIESGDIEDKVELLKVYSIGALDEIHEAMHEFSWKSWASDKFINKDPFVSEIADTMLFLFNMLAVVGATGEDLEFAIEAKTRKNFARATSGYRHDTNKCKSCGRALDDYFTLEEIKENNIEKCKSC